MVSTPALKRVVTKAFTSRDISTHAFAHSSVLYADALLSQHPELPSISEKIRIDL
jgi:hypothetical protein